MLLELVCIRWVPAYVSLFGFFINFVLLGSLLGIGVGMLSAARLKLPNFPILLLILVIFVWIFHDRFSIPTGSMLFYGTDARSHGWWGFLLLPVIFLLLTLLFMPLGRILAGAFGALPPLEGYRYDIIGSLAGIAVFTSLAWFSTPPLAWILVLALGAIPLFDRSERRAAALAFAGVFLVLALNPTDVWSPYYRISYTPLQPDGSRGFAVNGIGHQSASRHDKREAFYAAPYDLLGEPPFKRALIIGAGTGTDVAMALAAGVDWVDAVEIDPELYRLGRELHPEQPYDDPRVHVHIDDGRAFLRHTDGHYDLIIFALTDSMVLTSGYANLRLESFLFTVESLALARDHLTENGLLALYNYYREEWSVRRVAGMLEDVFGSSPFVVTYGLSGRAATLMAGPRLATLDPALDHPYGPDPNYVPKTAAIVLPVIGIGRLKGDPEALRATDDWPFFYLQNREIPGLYLAALTMVGFIALGFLRFATPRGTLGRFTPDFFCLGAAFMLLEARSLVVFSLLFGTTWIVNAFVFFAILSSVLLAILISARLRSTWLTPLYVILFGLLAANYAVPISALLDVGPSGLRYLLAAAFVFAPVFVANLIFADAFAGTTTASTAFAWNLIGIMLGGLCEYGALIIGYRDLLIVIGLLYLAAMASRVRNPLVNTTP